MTLQKGTPNAGADVRGSEGNEMVRQPPNENNITQSQTDGTEGSFNPLLAEALDLASQGARVFPCRERTTSEGKAKAPYIQPGHHGATTDNAQIRAWWLQWPNAMIGLVPSNSFFVVDIDVKEDANGYNTLRAWEAKYGALPKTAEVITPSGGKHLYYNITDGGASPYYNDREKLGIDFRGGGRGYVIAPPSVNYDMNPPLMYTWTEEQPRATDSPIWLVRLARQLDNPVPSLDVGPININDLGLSEEEQILLHQVEERASYQDILVDPTYRHGDGQFKHQADYAVAKEVLRKVSDFVSAYRIIMNTEVMVAKCGSHGELRMKKRMARNTLGKAAYEVDAERTGAALAKSLMDSFKERKRKARKALQEAADSFELSSARDLYEEDIEDIEFIVPNLAPIGAVVLAGPSEVGKSYLMTHIGLTKAAGEPLFGIWPQDPAPVLYLSLEANKAVLRTNMQQLHRGPAPKNFYYETEWPQVGKGGLTRLRSVIERYGIKLVMIDVWVLMQPEKSRDNNAYEQTYKDLDPLAKLGEETGCAIIVATHFAKKQLGSILKTDSYQQVVGGGGTVARAGHRILFYRNPESEGLILQSGGRNTSTSTQTWGLESLAKEGGYGWRIVDGNRVPNAKGPSQQIVLDIIRKAGRVMTPKDIKTEMRPDIGSLSITECPEEEKKAWKTLDNQVTKALGKLLEQDLVINEDGLGRYSARIFDQNGNGNVPQNFAEALAPQMKAAKCAAENSEQGEVPGGE